jgi:SAM-dependent methyltransferase
MWSAFQRLCDQSPEVMTLLYMMGPDKIVEWIQSVGVANHSELAAFVPVVPPEELRAIVAAPEPEVFLWTGFVDLINFINLFRRHGGPNSNRPRVLDFGCGCGRMTRFFCHSSESWEVSASDVNPELVTFCSKNLKGVSTSLNSVEPPLPFAASSFDLVYSLSIFTHFREEYATTWLAELGRVLAPGGILIITTHGCPALRVIKGSVLHHQMFQMSADRVAQIDREFAAVPYVFQRYTTSVLEAAKAGAEYGNTFIHPDYIFRNWNNDQFAVLEHVPGGLRGWQDVVVLQRRAS